jgi:two-component system sensor histidine kinase/response regulator
MTPTPGPAAGIARILVVDDEAAQMKALCDTLRDHGYQTVGFESAEPALAALRRSKFELLLADLMMPGMGGIDLLGAALAADPDLVGIIMTGEGTIASAVEAMKTGALDYILKPFRLSVILPVLSRALAMRRLRMENAELQQRLTLHAAELESANRELEAFSHSVSHDLRAPLRAVSGFSQIMAEKHAEQLSPEGLRLLGLMSAGAARMDQLIESLLRLARSSRQTLSRRPVDTQALVQEAVRELRAEPGNLAVELRIGDLPECIGDLALLRQVWANLLSNAFKFAGRRERPAVQVGGASDGKVKTYYVRDNGAGFDMRYVEKLFGVFQRLHREDEFPGTGIGLSIAQRIVQRHGGRIWAEGELGKGAIFRFSLPD